MANYYVDLEAASDGSGTRISPWNTLTGKTYTVADEIRIKKSTDPVSTGLTGTFTNNSQTVTLSSSQGVLISNCDTITGWTQPTNVTRTVVSSGTNAALQGYIAQGKSHLNLSIAAAFTTGTVSVFDLGATTDLSAWNCVCLWIRSNVARTQTNDFSIGFCSDAAGTTLIAAYNINNTDARGTVHSPFPVVNIWYPVKINTPALPNNVRSIRITCNTDFGAVELKVDNIFVCSQSGFTIDSLIGHQNSVLTGGDSDDSFYPISSINGTSITLYPRGWSSYSGNLVGADIYRQETTKPSFMTTYTLLNNTQTFTNYALAPLNYVFGWDFSATDAENGITWLDRKHYLTTTDSTFNLNREGSGNFTNVTCRNLSFVRCGPRALTFQNQDRTSLKFVSFINSGIFANSSGSSYPISTTDKCIEIQFIHNCYLGYAFIANGQTRGYSLSLKTDKISNNWGLGISAAGHALFLGVNQSNGNDPMVIRNLSSNDGVVDILNNAGLVSCDGNSFVIFENPRFSGNTDNSVNFTKQARVYIESPVGWVDSLLIRADASTRIGEAQLFVNNRLWLERNATGAVYTYIEKNIYETYLGKPSLQIAFNDNFTGRIPLITLGQFFLKANEQVTFKINVRKTVDTVFNLCLISTSAEHKEWSPVYSGTTADTWQELELTVTPTKDQIGTLILSSPVSQVGGAAARNIFLANLRLIGSTVNPITFWDLDWVRENGYLVSSNAFTPKTNTFIG